MTRAAALRLARELEAKARAIENRAATAEELGRALAYRESAEEIRDRLGPDDSRTDHDGRPTGNHTTYAGP